MLPAPPTAWRLLAKVLNESVGIEHGLMTTIHAYTNDQVSDRRVSLATCAAPVRPP